MIPYRIGKLVIRLDGQIHNIADLRHLPEAPGESGVPEALPVALPVALPEAVPEAVRLLARGWMKWGRQSGGAELAQHLVGDHAVILRDETARTVCLIRNAVGTRPLYYRIDAGMVTAGFSVAELRQVPDAVLTPDIDWAARYLYGVSGSADGSAFHEIRKVPPGHVLTATDGRAPSVRRYHEWADDEPAADRRDLGRVAAYRAVLDAAVRCRTPAGAPFACENSGGLDSATIACILGRQNSDTEQRMLGVSFMTQPYEPDLIWSVARAAGIDRNVVFTGGTTVRAEDADIRQVQRVMGYPPEHGDGLGALMVPRLCRQHGISTVFSGFGGDEVVTGTALVERFALLDRRDLRTLLATMPGTLPLRVLRLLKLASVGRQAPGVRPGMQRWIDGQLGFGLVRPEVETNLGIAGRVQARAGFGSAGRRVNDLVLGYHFGIDHNISNRTELFTVMSRSVGVEYRWPLLDQRLIQQYLSTPGIEKLGPRMCSRYLHRRAVDDVVPERVNWKPGKDMGGGNYAMTGQQVRHVQEQARRHAAHLHPALDEMIDRERLATVVAALGDPYLQRRAERQIIALRHLNLWLHGDDLPG